MIHDGIEDFEKINILKNILKDSQFTEDQLAYKRLMNKIEMFTASSGQSDEVDTLVKSARELLNEISIGMSR